MKRLLLLLLMLTLPLLLLTLTLLLLGVVWASALLLLPGVALAPPPTCSPCLFAASTSQNT